MTDRPFTGVLVLTLLATACMPAFVKENEALARRFVAQNPEAVRILPGAEPDGRPLGFVQAGVLDGPKVVLIHGSPGSWEAFVRYLDDPVLQARAHLIAVDRPGYGRSGGGRPERSVSRQADLIRQVFELGDPQQPVILVGHSYGGPVAARMAMKKDPRLRGLIVVAGSVDPSLEETKWIQYPADWWIFRWMVPAALDVCNQEILALKPELEAMLDGWAQIRAPIHVVHGIQDDLVPVANASFIERQAPQVSVKVARIEGLNHFVPWLRYDLVQGAILSALDALQGSAPDGALRPR